MNKASNAPAKVNLMSAANWWLLYNSREQDKLDAIPTITDEETLRTFANGIAAPNAHAKSKNGKTRNVRDADDSHYTGAVQQAAQDRLAVLGLPSILELVE